MNVCSCACARTDTVGGRRQRRRQLPLESSAHTFVFVTLCDEKLRDFFVPLSAYAASPDKVVQVF